MIRFENYKTRVCYPTRISVRPTVKGLTSKNKQFLQAIGLTLKNEHLKHWTESDGG